MVDLSLVLPTRPCNRWHLAKEIGITNAVVHPSELSSSHPFWKYDELLGIKNWFNNAGIELSVIEGDVPMTDKTRLGLEGREEEIEAFKEFLRHCGKLDVPVVSYHWVTGGTTPSTGAHIATRDGSRTGAHISDRGGSYVTEYDNEKVSNGKTSEVEYTEDDLWEGLEYFLREVTPVAERAGVKLALHPDDPPRPEVGGVPRIIRSVDAYDKVLDIYDSEHNGITFCQGNFALMDADIPETIRMFDGRINYVHFRDVRGDIDQFRETWHDAGPTDMLAAMNAYKDIGFDGPMRPDHVPTMTGEDNSRPGYHMKGRLYAIGYMRGLLEQVQNN